MATAVQVEALWSGLTDNSGSPLAAGKVYTYYAGTSTPVSLYTASDKSTLATNPLILDGNGRAQVWGDGRYKFVVKTSADVTLYTLDNLLYGFDDSTAIWCGAAGGTGNAVTVSAPSVTQYSEGTLSFIAASTNTGAVTLNLNSLGTIAITKGANRSPLSAGDIQEGQVVTVVYEVYGGVGRFRLSDYPTVADIQLSRLVTASNVAGTNVITADLTPAIYQYEVGQLVRFKAAATNSASVTLNLNGKGAKAVQYKGQALTGGEIVQNFWHEVIYDGTQFQLLNPVNVTAPIWAGTTSGTSTALTLTPAYPIGSYITGQKISFIAHASNGVAPTLAVSGLAAKSIVDGTTQSSIGANRIVNGKTYEVIYDGTQFRLLDNVADIQNGDYVWLGTTGGTAQVMTASATPALTAYKAGQKFRMRTGTASDGIGVSPHSLNINGLGARSIKTAQGAIDPTIGDWLVGSMLELLYDGSTFIIMNAAGGWTDWAPTLTPNAGSATGISYDHKTFQKYSRIVHVQLQVNWTQAGAAATYIDISAPVAPYYGNQTITTMSTFGGVIYIGLALIVGPSTIRCYNIGMTNFAVGPQQLIIGGTYMSA